MNGVAVLTFLTQVILFIVIVSLVFKSTPLTLAKRIIDQFWRSVTGTPIERLSRITPQLYVGGQHNHRGWRKMQDMGITAIVNMREEQYDDRARQIAPENYLHLPTIDGTPPTLEHLCEGVAFITDQIAKGNKVYIHCASGFHRAATMTTAYLMSTGLTPADALAQIRKVRPFARPISSQMKQLDKFANELHNCP